MKKITVGVLLVLMFAALIVTGCDGLGRTVEVPDLTKSTLENAKMSLEKRGLLIYVVEKIESDDVEEGLICKQDPLLLSDVRRGSTVKVWLSTGSSKVDIPAMEKASLNDVLRKLAELELYSNVEFVYSYEVAKDMVISLDPLPGTKVEKNSYVKVYVSMGAEPVSTAVVPKATRMSKSAAKAAVEKAGLEAKFIYRVSTEYYEGTIYYQTPKSGSVVPIGSTVTIYIATVLD